MSNTIYIMALKNIVTLINCIDYSCYTNKMIIEMAEDYQLHSFEEIGEKSFGLLVHSHILKIFAHTF